MASMMQSVFSDTAWSVWEPLIEEVHMKGKIPPKNLRRMISAIFWRHQNGAKWLALPSEFGPWWIAAQLFIRWSTLGVWQRLFEKVKDKDLALSSRQGRMIQKSPVQNGFTDTGIWSKICRQGSRNGGLSRPDIRKPRHPSSLSSSSLLQQTISRSNRPYTMPQTRQVLRALRFNTCKSSCHCVFVYQKQSDQDSITACETGQ